MQRSMSSLNKLWLWLDVSTFHCGKWDLAIQEISLCNSKEMTVSLGNPEATLAGQVCSDMKGSMCSDYVFRTNSYLVLKVAQDALEKTKSPLGWLARSTL